MLHAQRLLTYHGEAHGAIHVYVGDDFWSLPFVQGRDPYSVLYRNTARGGLPDRPVSLLVYDTHRDVAFSSAERPPALDPGLAARALEASRRGEGVWTTLEVDGRAPARLRVLRPPTSSTPSPTGALAPGRYAADLVEAVAAFTLLGACRPAWWWCWCAPRLRRPTLSLPSLARRASAGASPCASSSPSPLVAFVPVAVLQVVVSGFVADRLRRESEDQALERAAVAKKAVEDYAFFQRGEASGPRAGHRRRPGVGGQPWSEERPRRLRARAAARLEQARAVRLRPAAPRACRAPSTGRSCLEGQPVGPAHRAHRRLLLPGGLRARARSAGPSTAILSMPLALRQREVEATVDDLDRTIRLASVVFLGLAAALAHSMSRRISGPIRDLTRATRRVAQGDLEARVEATSQDELRELVESFNQMAGDLDAAAARPRAQQPAGGLGGDGAPGRARGEEPAHSHPALRRAPAARLRATAARTSPPPWTTCTDTILKQVRNAARHRHRVLGLRAPARARARAPGPRGRWWRRRCGPTRPACPRACASSWTSTGPCPPVRADRRLLERAVVNLLENALQAVGDAGTIAVQPAARTTGGAWRSRSRTPARASTPEVRDRIFEPFFSTKTSGSGLGLALVKKIAEDHGGGVRLREHARRADACPSSGCRPRISPTAATPRPTGALALSRRPIADGAGSGDGASSDLRPFRAVVGPQHTARDARPVALAHACGRRGPSGARSGRRWASGSQLPSTSRTARPRRPSDPRSRSTIPAATSFISSPLHGESLRRSQ